MSSVIENDAEAFQRLFLRIGENISLEVISTWTDDQKFMACQWAGRIYSIRTRGTPAKTIPKRPLFLPVEHEQA